MPDPLIQDPVNCSTAVDFIDALSPLGPSFRTLDLSEQWLFRGQGYDWRLIPSLFRNYGRISELARMPIRSYRDMLFAERDLLVFFFEMADRRGLVLPDDSQRLRDLIETLQSKQFEQNINGSRGGVQPSDDLLALTALAQHYQFPTRLLDWTPRAFVAAYFAAEGAWERGSAREPGDLMVVWSLKFDQIGKQNRTTDDAPIRVVTAPSATNPNLKAQQGVFTWLHPEYSNERNINYSRRTDDTKKENAENEYCAINEVLDAAETTGGSGAKAVLAGCTMRKYTAPAQEAENLLFLLAKLDVTPSAIYPGYHTLIKDLKVRSLWP